MAGMFALVVVAIVVLAFFGWGFFGPKSSWVSGLVHMMVVLITTCSHMLGLATPMSVMVASGRAATQGILFHDAVAIEQFRKVDTLIVDKAGTLTEGHPAFEQALDVSLFIKVEAIRLAASLGQDSEHPLVATIVTAVRERNLALGKVEQFTTNVDMDVRGQADGDQLIPDNAALMRQEHVNTEPLALQADALRRRGASVMYLAVGRELAGLLVISDPIKVSMPEALVVLKVAETRMVMASDDSIVTARAAGGRPGIEEFHGRVKPADKLALVVRLQAEGHMAAMADDSINDAPTLAKADVDIAMGTGTDVVVYSTQVTLVRGDLRSLACARELS